MTRHRRPITRHLGALAAASFAVIVAACSASGAASPASSAPPTGGQGSGAPSPSATPPSASPSVVPAGTIDHPTGATDVILRYDEGGGFVMPAFAATMVPWFTLYGDGTMIFRNPNLEPPPAQGSVMPQGPMRVARLDEEQIQGLLAYALTEGGLAGARESYENVQVADASTAIFTIDAGGIKKAVSVYALGMEPPAAGQPGGADGPARLAFQKLAAHLTDVDAGGAFTSDVYAPAMYRAILMDGTGIAAPDTKDWPWTDLAVKDFAPSADPTGLQFPHRTLTKAQVEALGVKDPEGGFQGAVLRGPDRKVYTLSVRPLLPDETD